MESDLPLTSSVGSAIGATFSSPEETQKAITALKTAGFAGSEISLAANEVTLTVTAAARGADAERVLREVGGIVTHEMTDAEILAAAENIQVSPSARAAVSFLESAEQGVPPTTAQPHAGDDDKSGRLIS